MYDFPIIPIMLFALMIVPPMVIGFFRGWKASLFIMLATLALVGIEIGISFAIYDSLWDMLNRFIIDDLQQGLSKDALKEVGKSTIIILFIGLCMLPTYGIVMALYFPINKKLRRHLFPKTEEINQHQKSITRSVHWASRTSGMAIAATSGLFFAASASSAAATLFTPLEKRTKFTDFTSDMARLYTFGSGTNDKALQIVHRFAKNDLTAKYQEDLSQILYFGQADVRAGIISSINEMATGQFHNRLNEVASNDDAMLAVVDLIINSQSFFSRPQFFLEDTAYEELDKKGDKKPGAMPHLEFDQMKARLNSYNNLPSLNLHLSETIINGMLAKIKDRTIMPFEKTGFYKRWEDGANFLNYLNQEKSKLISEEEGYQTTLRTQLSDLRSIYGNINSLKSQIIGLGVVNGSTKTYKYVTPQGAVQNLTVSSNGIIHRNEQELASLTTQVNNAQTIYDAAKTKYDGIKLIDDSNRNDMNVAKGEMDVASVNSNSAKQVYDTALRNLQSSETGKANAIAILNRITDSYLNNIQSEIDTAKRLLDAEIATLRGLNNDINTLNSSRSAKLIELNNEKTKLNHALSDITTHRQTITTISAELIQLRRDKASYETQKISNNEIIRRNTATISSLNPATHSAEIARLNAEITTANNMVNKLTGQINTAATSIRTKEASIQSVNAQINTLTTNKANYEAKVATIQGEVNSLDSQLRSKTGQLSTHTIERDKQENIYLSKQQLHQGETAKQAQAKTSRDRYANDIITYTKAKKAAKTDLDQKNAVLQSKTSAYTAKKKAYDDYHSATYEPALVDMQNKNKALSDLTTRQFNKRDELNSNIAKLDGLIQQIEAKVAERATKITEVYSTSDLINEINSVNKPPHSGETHHDGTTDIVPDTYVAKQAQSSAFTRWALSTIPGIKAYINGASKDTQSYKGIMEAKRIEYKELQDQYLAKIAEILRS